MPEKFIPQEALQGDLAEQLEQAIEQAPDIPTDREKLFKSLSAKKAAMLAALLTVTGLASEVSAEEAFYDKPANVKVEELPKSQRGDKSTMYLYGHQLEDFSNKLEDTDPNTTTAGETGQATIKHLVRMISFCEHAGSKLEDVYDLSSIPNNLIEEAKVEYEEAQKAAKGMKYEKPPKKVASHEKLGRKST